MEKKPVRPTPYNNTMYQSQLTAGIFFLFFIAHGVSGLHFPKGHHPHGGHHHRHGGHHRFPHRHPTLPHRRTPKLPIPAHIPALPHHPKTTSPPSLLDAIIGAISEHGKLFGWDPRKAMRGCGHSCDLIKHLRQQEFLVAHNWVRKLYKLPLFTWDEKLENAAKETVMKNSDECKMSHSDLPYGENIFWGLKLHWTPSDAVFSWYNESVWYNLMTLQCSAPRGDVDCGHFTQVVWKDSVRLGCALQHCHDPRKGMLVVCEYDPPGNYDNENPLDDNNAKFNH